jgi:hypothetical protein
LDCGRLRIGWRVNGSPAPFALRQAVALAVHLQDVDVVRETVEQHAANYLAMIHIGMILLWL